MGPQSTEKSCNSNENNGQGWKVDGWVRWLAGLRGAYERRMQTMCQILEEGKYQFKSSTPRKSADTEWSVIDRVQMYDFQWPRGGMFIWVEIKLSSHPLFGKVDNIRLADALWAFLTTKPYLVLVVPGKVFSTTPQIATTLGWSFFRLCFAAVSDEEVKETSHRLVAGFKAFWKKKSVNDINTLLLQSLIED